MAQNIVCVLLGAAMAAMACSGESNERFDAPPMNVDATPNVDAIPTSEYGTTCDGDGQCGSGSFCLGAVDDWPDRGYCTRQCTDDTECGPGAFCSDAPNRLCFAACSAGDSCLDPNHICAQTLGGGTTDLGRSGCVPGKLVDEGAPCRIFADCRPSQRCEADAWILPGGTCATPGCTIGDDSTCAPRGHCADFGGGTICVRECTGDGDCRTVDGYRCYDSQDNDIGKFCAFLTHTGDACSVSDDCGPTPWQCVTGTSLVGGYCGALGCDPAQPLNPTLCNTRDSVCHDLTTATGDEICVRVCTVQTQATDCRVADGYTCQDLDGADPGTTFGCLP